MGIDPSCNVKIYDMICGSKADEVTTIFKEKRLEMHAYLRDAETRGSSRMVTEPNCMILSTTCQNPKYNSVVSMI
jgi:hypothetical protein